MGNVHASHASHVWLAWLAHLARKPRTFGSHGSHVWLAGSLTRTLALLSRINCCVILTADSALCIRILPDGLLPGETLSAGELTAGVKEGVAGNIPERFLEGGTGKF